MKNLCECGCGFPSPPSKRFISGHNVRKGAECISWKGGKTKGDGRSKSYFPNHPKAQANGYVLDSVLVAERVLGKPLPPKAIVHHHGDLSDDYSIVICEDRAYHNLIHKRTRAYRECGNADWLKCPYCKKYDAPENLHIIQNGSSQVNCHPECKRKYTQLHKAKKNEQV